MEPMSLGSPSGNSSPSTSNLLPAYLLMNDLNTPSRGNFSALSPTKRSLAFVSSPATPQIVSSTVDFNRSMPAAASHSPTKLFRYHHAQQAAETNVQAPPTVGLFDSLKEARNSVASPSPHQRQQAPSASNLSATFYQDSFLNQSAPGATFNSTTRAERQIMSPIQNLSTLREAPALPSMSNFWITVFGFAPSSLPTILAHFSTVGTIVDKSFPPNNANWIHLKYSSRRECDKALNYNGKIIANSIMIGVIRCSDAAIVGDDAENLREEPVKLRPLTRVAYEVAQSPKTVEPPEVFSPRAGTGIVSKAMDFLFGW